MAQPIQRLGSRELVVSRLPLERYCGAITIAIALSRSANRRPANSRAMRAVCTTKRADSSAGIKRILRSESPNTAREMRIKKGMSGAVTWPGEVIAASDVIKLVAEVAVAAIEVAVEEQLSQCDGQNNQHAGSKPRALTRLRTDHHVVPPQDSRIAEEA